MSRILDSATNSHIVYVLLALHHQLFSEDKLDLVHKGYQMSYKLVSLYMITSKRFIRAIWGIDLQTYFEGCDWRSIWGYIVRLVRIRFWVKMKLVIYIEGLYYLANALHFLRMSNKHDLWRFIVFKFYLKFFLGLH